MTEDDLFQFNIKFTGLLKLKADYNVRVAATKQLGKNEHWSSEGLYRHLCVLKKLIPRVGKLYMKRNGHKSYTCLNPSE